MSAPENHSIRLPVADDIIVKIPETATFALNNIFIFNGSQFLYSSTQEIADKFVTIVTNSRGNKDFLEKEELRSLICFNCPMKFED